MRTGEEFVKRDAHPGPCISFFDEHPDQQYCGERRIRAQGHSQAVLNSLFDALRKPALRARLNANLVFAAINGALLRSARLMQGGRVMEDEEVFPSCVVQDELARSGICSLITSFISTSTPVELASRVARLGCLLMNPNNAVVQQMFQEVEEQDVVHNNRSNFLVNISAWLKRLVASARAADKVFAQRLLRVLQLLCESRNTWWQHELRTQNCPLVADLVHVLILCHRVHLFITAGIISCI